MCSNLLSETVKFEVEDKVVVEVEADNGLKKADTVNEHKEKL